MALFNKLFSSRKKGSKHQDIISNQNVFVFNKEQSRIVLFRECEFSGRKLLFDSHSVEKVELAVPATDPESSPPILAAFPNDTYVEISNGYGYQFIKPCADIGHLAEMVFGAVAMSYRGTSLKIHSLKSPSRLMCSQIFSTPRHSSRGCNSAPGHIRTSLNSSQSLEQSVRFDDSGRSSANSISDRLSVNSTGSETLLVCKPLGSCTFPLDVPANTLIENLPNNRVCTPCFIGDSGFYGDQSYNSNSSGLYSLPPMCFSINEGQHSFSCGSLYKRWLRSSSTSFEHSINLLTASASADDCLLKPHSRNSKLGLAIIVELTYGQEESLEQFLMEHVAHLESLVWRTRQEVEIAYIRHSNFVSLMFEVAASAIQWIVDLLMGPQLSTHMWMSLLPVCDKSNSINSFNKSRTLSSTLDERTHSFSKSVSSASFHNSIESNFSASCDSTETLSTSTDFSLVNLTKFFKNEWCAFSTRNNCDKNLAEKCVVELCELLDCVDVKHTNFFISTLVTAVLTHHLGWVTTVLPPSSNDKQQVSKLHNPCNPLWGQLTDLYGATGRPSKMAQTIVTGTNKVELISKILNSLTYFIRCSDAKRKWFTRLDINDDNYKVDCIFQEKCCIPKENFKSYCVDRITEKENLRILDVFKKPPNTNVMIENIEMRNLNQLNETYQVPHKTLGLTKSKTNMCLTDLHTQIDECVGFLSLGDTLIDPVKSCDVHETQSTAQTTEHVVFVLGDSDALINIKKEKMPRSLETQLQTLSIGSTVVSQTTLEDSDCEQYEVNNNIKPSTSWSLPAQHSPDVSCENHKEGIVYSQNSPAEEGKPQTSTETKLRCRYSGVKFNFQQYPQIVTNYMRGKNLELAQLPIEKTMKFSSVDEYSTFDFFLDDAQSEEVERLQTPSNASELEFTSDLVSEKYQVQQATEKRERKLNKTFVRNTLPNTCVVEQHPLQIEVTTFEQHKKIPDDTPENEHRKMQLVELVLPRSQSSASKITPTNYTNSLMRDIGEHYISDMVLQGITAPKCNWEAALRKDLSLAARHSLLDQPVDEAVAIVANTDTWEVQLLSSHTYVVDRGSSGVRVGMSQLVSNMLESLLFMWKLRTPPEYCIMHIEQRLQEFCTLSKALAELLLATEFCSMDLLTSVLQLEVNDVPLLMAVASTHSPQVTQKYGLSFQ